MRSRSTPAACPVAAHIGLIEGITDAVQVRDLLVSRMRHVAHGRAGDEHHEHDSTAGRRSRSRCCARCAMPRLNWLKGKNRR